MGRVLETEHNEVFSFLKLAVRTPIPNCSIESRVYQHSKIVIYQHCPSKFVRQQHTKTVLSRGFLPNWAAQDVTSRTLALACDL